MTDTDQQRNPATPINAATYRTLRMQRHLEINAPGVCVPCYNRNIILTMVPASGGLRCNRCGHTRGN